MQIGDKVMFIPFVLRYAKDTELKSAQRAGDRGVGASKRTVRRRGAADGILHLPGVRPGQQNDEERGTKL